MNTTCHFIFGDTVDPISLLPQATKPILEKLSQLFTETLIEKKDIFVHTFINTFDKYLQRTYEKYHTIPAIALKRKRRKLADIYVPLTIYSDSRKYKNEYLIAEKSSIELFIPNKNIIISDSAGMGKSTILKYLLIDCIDNFDGKIPIFIELRKLRKDRDIIKTLVEQFNEIDQQEFSEKAIKHLISRGDFIFLLDGYDEIQSDEREFILESMHYLIERGLKNNFIITSRDEPGLSSFSNFTTFNITPLEEKDAFLLIEKYSEKSEIGYSLINKLQTEKTESVQEFLYNPLLVSLLLTAYEHKSNIPIRKQNFYRQVFDALFEDHDLSKELEYVRKKDCDLPIDKFHALLRALGIITLPRGTEYNKDQILSHIESAKRLSNTTDCSSSLFLSDLLKKVPLFVVDGNSYAWVHKSMQEYFAAQYICTDSKRRQAQHLQDIINSKTPQKYSNTLDLCAEIDEKTFMDNVGKIVPVEFINIHNNIYRQPYGVADSDVLIRKSYCVFTIYGTVGTQALKDPKAQNDASKQISSLAERIKQPDATYQSTPKLIVNSAGVVISIYHKWFFLAKIMKKYGRGDWLEEIDSRKKSQIACDNQRSLEFRKATKDDLTTIDDSPKNPYNNPEIFNETSQTLLLSSGYIYHHEKAESTLTILNQNSQTSEEEELIIAF